MMHTNKTYLAQFGPAKDPVGHSLGLLLLQRRRHASGFWHRNWCLCRVVC